MEKLKHDRVNAAMLEYCQNLLEWCDGATPRSDLEWYRSKVAHDIKDVCQDEVCLDWAEDAISKAYHACIAKQTEAVLMHVQQARMFLNQGIAIDELRGAKCRQIVGQKIDIHRDIEFTEEFWDIDGVQYKRAVVFAQDAICWQKASEHGWKIIPIEEWPALEKVRESATITTGLT